MQNSHGWVSPVSTPAPARERLTNGYATIPNSLIENQGFLTRAELALALIIVRRGGTSEHIPISDRTWEEWTGLGSRQKEYASAGLKNKGITIEGRGDKARYQWHRDMWQSFVRQAVRDRAKTEGRKTTPVPAKRGAMVHPACRENGCAMMAAADPQAAGPVLVNLPAAPARSWPETLATIQRWFPMVGSVFAQKLAAIAQRAVGPVDDPELAKAVAVAFEQKRRRQESEGLFLETVPEALAALRRVKVSSESIAEAIDESENLIAKACTAVLAVLRERGPAFAPILPAINRLLVESADAAADLDTLERKMMLLDNEIIAAADLTLTAMQRQAIENRVAVFLKELKKTHRIEMLPHQLHELEAGTRRREIMKELSIPRLSAFYII